MMIRPPAMMILSPASRPWYHSVSHIASPANPADAASPIRKSYHEWTLQYRFILFTSFERRAWFFHWIILSTQNMLQATDIVVPRMLKLMHSVWFFASPDFLRWESNVTFPQLLCLNLQASENKEQVQVLFEGEVCLDCSIAHIGWGNAICML